MNSKPIYVLECSLTPDNEMFPVDASHDLGLLLRRAEGFVETLYGCVTKPDVTEGMYYGYPHHPRRAGEQKAAIVHCVEGRYEEMLGMARRHIERKAKKQERT